MFKHKYKKRIKGRFFGSTTPEFSPTDITGISLWLDGTDESTMYDATTGGSLVSLNGAVARWEDKSGFNRHAVQTTVNNRPLRKSGYLEFDGTDDSMIHGFTNGTDAFQGVIFAVYQGLSVQGGYRGIFATSNATVNGTMFLAQVIAGGWGTYGSMGEKSANTPAWQNLLGVRTLIDNAGTGGEFRFNGSSDGTYSPGDTTGQGGGHVGGDNGQFTHMKFMEIIVYNNPLSTEDIEAVENYLIAKHSI